MEVEPADYGMNIHLPIAAGIGIEGIIWLIILIFWGIAQAVQKSRNSRRPGSPPAPSSTRRTASPFDDELREMLEQLAGRTSTPTRAEAVEDMEDEEEFTPAPPPPPRPQRPPPVQRPAHQPPPRPSVQAQRAHARQFSPPHPPPSRLQYPTTPLPPPEAIPEMAAMISAEDFAASMSIRSGLNSPGISMRMKGMSLQGMATMPSGNPAGRHGAPILSLNDLRDPRQLRKAILAKAVLDPPRGLVPYGASNQF